jgi:hypothetical protein
MDAKTLVALLQACPDKVVQVGRYGQAKTEVKQITVTDDAVILRTDTR